MGVVMVGSSSVAGAGMDVGPFYFLIRHVMFLAGGLVLAGFAMRTELKIVEQHSQLLLLACFVAVDAGVSCPGWAASVNGARRWINLGVSKFQVVEAVKLLYIVWLASYLERYSEEVGATWMAMLKPLGVVGALVGLLLLQPDFGSSVAAAEHHVCMLLLGGVTDAGASSCRSCCWRPHWLRWWCSSRIACAG